MNLEQALSPAAIHDKAVAGARHKEVRKALQDLTKNINARTFDAAELFHEAQEGNYFLDWGYESLGEYAEKELGIKERKAQYLARIVKVCKQVGLTRKHYEPAGVSKLREITRLDPDGFYFNKTEGHNYQLDELIVDLILEAPDKSIHWVKDQVAEYMGLTGDERLVPRMFAVTQSCWENVFSRALELAAKNIGPGARDDAGNAIEPSLGAKLEVICVSYLQDPNNTLEDEDDTREDSEAVRGSGTGEAEPVRKNPEGSSLDGKEDASDIISI